jgi:hypothetical protein
MKTLLLIALFSLPGWCQGAHKMSTILTLSCPATYTPGAPLICTVSKAGDLPASLQFTFGSNLIFRDPLGVFAAWTAVVAGAALGADKGLEYNSSTGVCIIFGLNTETIPDGVVARITVPIPVGMTGTLVFSLSSAVGATADGTSIPTTVSGPASTTLAVTAGIYFAVSYFPWIGANPIPAVSGPPGRAAARITGAARGALQKVTQ